MKTIIRLLKELFGDIGHTLFPDLCLGCDRLPKIKDGLFCVECLHKMPYTDHFVLVENEVSKHFKGRVKLHHAGALLRFKEGSFVQGMLHRFKYQKRKEIGEILGEIAALKYKSSTLYVLPDLIIPVAIHPKKKLKRGYNQSTIFGQALANILDRPCRDDILIKEKWSESQTGKSRTQRVSNVEEMFLLQKPNEVYAKHILLVDDVVTTGATLEACCNILIQGGTKQISILTIAVAG